MEVAEVVIDHRGSPVKHTQWRTLAVFAHTLSCSMRVLGRAAAGRASPERIDGIVERWYEHCFRISAATLSRSGHLGLGAPSVLLSNHHSLLDIPAICATFPGRVRFVAKAELRQVPGFGAAMERAGIVFVDRSDRQAAIRSLDEAWKRIGTQTSLWIAAEGGRTDAGPLQSLKKGPFHVAIDAQVPLVPVWIRGTEGVLPARTLHSTTGGAVRVVYGEPIPTEGCSTADLPDLMKRATVALHELERLP